MSYLLGMAEGAGPAAPAVHAAVPDAAPEHRPVAARIQSPLSDSSHPRATPARPAPIRPRPVRGPPR